MIYAYASLTVTDPEKLAAYRGHAADALAKHGGQLAAAGADFTVLDGAPNQPNVAAIMTFPDRDAALGWINDPELADIHALRRGAGQSDILLLG